MAKGYQANKEHMAAIQMLGKGLAKRAGFRCEWCGGGDDLRPWDYRPDQEPEEAGLALLCSGCRELADGRQGDAHQLRVIRDALWSDIPAVAEGARGCWPVPASRGRGRRSMRASSTTRSRPNS